MGMTQASSRAWILLLAGIGLLAFVLRWYYVTHAMVNTPIRSDALEYYYYAWNLLHHGVFSMAKTDAPQVMSDGFRDPGYPVFLASWIAAFGEFPRWYLNLLVGQALLGALTVMMLMSAARTWLSTRWLAGAGVLMAIWPHSITITGFALTETLFGFLIAAALCVLSVALRRGSGWLMALTGLLFGMAALTNAMAIPLAPCLALLLWMMNRAPRRLLATLALSALLLPLCWGLRNVQVGGASSGSRAAMNLVQGSWPDYHDNFYRYAVDHDAEATKKLGLMGSEIRLVQEHPGQGLSSMAQRMSAAPGHYIAWYLSKPALLWGWSIRVGAGDIYVYPTTYSPFYDKLPLRVIVSVCYALNPVLMLFMLIGCIAAWLHRRQADPILIVIMAMAAFVTLVYSILQAEPRYSIPFRGIELLLAAYGASQLVRLAIARRTAVQTGPT
ncbi:glycosyltransferase family 39 protein [Dyella marensis]